MNQNKQKYPTTKISVQTYISISHVSEFDIAYAPAIISQNLNKPYIPYSMITYTIFTVNILYLQYSSTFDLRTQ